MSSLLRHLIKQQGAFVLWSDCSAEEQCCTLVQTAKLALPFKVYLYCTLNRKHAIETALDFLSYWTSIVTQWNIWALVQMVASVSVLGWNKQEGHARFCI